MTSVTYIDRRTIIGELSAVVARAAFSTPEARQCVAPAASLLKRLEPLSEDLRALHWAVMDAETRGAQSVEVPTHLLRFLVGGS